MTTATEALEVIQELHRALDDAAGRMTSAVATLAGLSLNNVLLTEQLRLGKTLGHAHREFRVPFASIGIWAYECDVVVSSGPAQLDTPDVGHGVFTVPLGRFAVLPLAGLEVNLFGVTNAKTLLMAWSTPQVPSVGGTASGVDGGSP